MIMIMMVMMIMMMIIIIMITMMMMMIRDLTTYQNYEAGVAYVPAGELIAPGAQLSRFQVSPPHPGNNPRRLGPGTLLNNHRGATHAARGWIYGENHSRLAKKLSLPKKV